MPTDLLDSSTRPDPAPSPTRRRVGAALYVVVASALVVLVVFAAGLNYALAHEYGGGIGMPWVVAVTAFLVWVLLAAAARDWLGRRALGRGVNVAGGLTVVLVLVAGYQMAEWAGARAKAEDARAATACTSHDAMTLNSVPLPAGSFVPVVDGAPDGSCRLRFRVRGDAGRVAEAALLAQGWQRAGTEPDTETVRSRVRWTRAGQVVVSGVELGPDEAGEGTGGVLVRP